MNIRSIRAIARRDIKTIMRSKGVLLPLVLVPIILMVILPGAVGLLMPSIVSSGEMDDLATFLNNLPPTIMEELHDYNEAQTMLVIMLTYFFAPMFLILPMMVASTIAADSFAGEKERKTLEALLYTPTTDTELFVGKMLAAWIPAVLVAVGSFVLYSVVANAAGWRVMGRFFFPNLMWVLLVVWVVPAAAGLGLGTMILVSSKVSSFQEAYQLGSAVVLPVVLLILGQVAGVVYLTPGVVLIVGLILWVLDAAILWLAVRTFKRDEIIARL